MTKYINICEKSAALSLMSYQRIYFWEACAKVYHFFAGEVLAGSLSEVKHLSCCQPYWVFHSDCECSTWVWCKGLPLGHEHTAEFTGVYLMLAQGIKSQKSFFFTTLRNY